MRQAAGANVRVAQQAANLAAPTAAVLLGSRITLGTKQLHLDPRLSVM